MTRRVALFVVVVGCGSAGSSRDDGPSVAPAPPSAPASVGPSCGALRQAARDKIAARTRDPTLASTVEEEAFRCAALGGFVWAFEPVSVWIDEAPQDSPYADGIGALVRVAPDGSRAERRFDFRLGFGTTTISGLEVLDLDGDGTPEAFVETTYGDPYAPTIVGRELLTVEGGVLVQVPGTARLDIHALRDVDSDGMLDLVGTEFQAIEDRCEGGDIEVTGPTVVWHGTRGGRFAPDDQVAVASAIQACDAPPTPPYYGFEGSGRRAVDLDRRMTERTVACARIWAIPTAEIVRSLREVCRTFGAVCISDTGLEPTEIHRCPATYLRWAEQDPATKAR